MSYISIPSKHINTLQTHVLCSPSLVDSPQTQLQQISRAVFSHIHGLLLVMFFALEQVCFKHFLFLQTAG